MEENYPDEFHVDIEYEPKLKDKEWLSQYDLVHFHRQLGPYEEMEDTMKRLNELNIPAIMDIDDYWTPDESHPAYPLIKREELDKKIINNLKLVDHVTTTTSIYGDEIKKLNKNVHIFPNGVDPREKQFIPNPEKSDKIRIGWLGGSCFTPDTEVLTDDGWKCFQNLEGNEKIATLNKENEEIEYHKPINYIKNKYEGKIYQCDNKNVSFSVTPNHNMLASRVKHLTHKKLNYELTSMESIKDSHFHVKKNAEWNGEEKEYFILPKYKNPYSENNMDHVMEVFENKNENLIHEEDEDAEFLKEYENEVGVITESNNTVEKTIKLRKSPKNNYYISKKTYMGDKYGTDKELPMDDWLKFFGFWLAEGWTSTTDTLNQVGVAQSKNNGCLEEMFQILTRLGFTPTYTKDNKQIRVFDVQLWQYLKQFGKANEKHVPKDLKNLSTRQLNILIEWFIKGDGHTEKNKYKRNRAWTTSKKLADDLQEMALKTGVSANITNRGKNESVIENRNVNSYYDCYQIGFSKHPSESKHNQLNPLVRNEHVYEKEYNGYVYCVEVPNNIMYVRRNGKAFWCGNSHKDDLELLRGLPNKLKTDGLLDKIQFVVCGFDLRGTVTEVDNKTGERKQRKITPKESVWYQYEQIFTDNYTTISKDYRDHLLRFSKDEEYKGDIEKEPYRRVWTKPITSYATNYNLFDISLAPLVPHTFNKMKSDLKAVEAGFHKKALIAQNFGPYTLNLKNAYEKGGGVNDDGNAFLVDTKRNHKDWYKYLKLLINNPELINELGERLHETVNDIYDLNELSRQRREFYNRIIDENDQNRNDTKTEDNMEQVHN